MSAYICEKNHFVYLVTAAQSPCILHCGGGFSWYHNGERKELRPGDLSQAAEAANLLYLENIRSVAHRYPSDKTSAALPGPKDSSLVTERDVVSWVDYDPIQVLKSIRCLSYQICEHPDWEASEAYAFLQALKERCISVLPGISDAVWGYPERNRNLVSLSDLRRRSVRG